MRKTHLLILAFALLCTIALTPEPSTAKPFWYNVWDTGDQCLVWTEAPTQQGAIDIFLAANPGYTWSYFQSLGYTVRQEIP